MTFSSRFRRYCGARLCSQPKHPLQTPIMRRDRCSLLTVALFSFSLVQPGHAKMLRCGTKLVREGDLAIQVREKIITAISQLVAGAVDHADADVLFDRSGFQSLRETLHRRTRCPAPH